MTDSELTKVSQEELSNIDEFDENVYSSDYKRLIRCTPCPEENNFLVCEYDFSEVSVICDYACSDKTCGYFYLDKEIEVNLPEGITHIGDFAFKGRNIDWLEIPHSLTYMGRDPFALSSIYRIENKNEIFVVRDGSIIDTQENKLIHNISSEGKVTIPDGVVEIGEYSFSRLEMPMKRDTYSHKKEKDLTLIIPSTVHTIGDHAFQRNNLKSITFIGIPETIGEAIFEECTLLETIYVPKGAKAKFSELLPEYASIIDESGEGVNQIVYRNFLKSNGITDFYLIDYMWKFNIYGYIKDELFHFSDEQGNNLKREDIGIPNGVIVFDLVNEKYQWLKEKSSCKGKGIAVDGNNHISWIGHNENFYIKVSTNQIVIHKCEAIDDFVEQAQIGRNYNHRARLFGDNNDLPITSIDERWYYYTNKGKIKIICDGDLHPDQFDKIEVKNYKVGLSWKHFIIISKDYKWGFITLDNKYVKPIYSMIECLNNPYFFIVQKPDGCLGIASVYGEEILGTTNRYLNVDVVHCQGLDLIATTENNIYILCCEHDSRGEHDYSYRCSSLEIKPSEIMKLEIGNVYRFNYGRKQKTQFVYILKKDGKHLVFDNYGYDITDSDEYYKWKEHNWEVKNIIYDITPKEEKKIDNTFETSEHLNSADDLPF
ncbi:Leucine rich repeat-containing protein [Prevotella communis]|uniref:Leucine rich repeat-containing protein n=1 Tax=Prevotella communis TaxID=2913614 RepID=A0A1H0EGH4_9BACT|nr:leucine-rich repeat domain-containing protein [Prevotella communis]SDN81421.1 Leucine rich repeat-containing protein [Prevotella communis]